jgi:hypothetical protein
MNNSVIITTINHKTDAIAKFEELLPDWKVYLVGDKKSREIESKNNVKFLSVSDQQNLDFEIVEKLPYNHYVRKNIGYLFALKEGSQLVYDTDDDNLPYEDWKFPSLGKGDYETVANRKYFNIYSAFTKEIIWPRGYPLSLLSKDKDVKYTASNSTNKIGIWQGLADLDPDVDAIHRLIFNKNIEFIKRSPIVLARGTYCPFNSQNTLWQRDMLPYAYLPATVTFRFTDILRGYIAQRCLWEHNNMLGFTQATVYQERNEHDLMKDFRSEIPCYVSV